MNSLGFDKPEAATRVVVAMSGGVDSSVVAAMLALEGYEVVGVTLQLYDHGAAIHRAGACCAGQDIHDARRVAERLNIPHYVLDYESRFKEEVIDRFAETLGPLALVSVGLQWQASHLKKFVKELSWGLGFKLLLAPVLIFFIYSAFSYHPDLKKIVVLEAAMGPMITGGIIAMQKNINPPLVAAMLSVGIPLSLLTSLLVRLFFR